MVLTLYALLQLWGKTILSVWIYQFMNLRLLLNDKHLYQFMTRFSNCHKLPTFHCLYPCNKNKLIPCTKIYKFISACCIFLTLIKFNTSLFLHNYNNIKENLMIYIESIKCLRLFFLNWDWQIVLYTFRCAESENDNDHIRILTKEVWKPPKITFSAVLGFRTIVLRNVSNRK